MKQTCVMPESDLVCRMTGALIAQFGPVETQRFVSLCGGKRMESVRRHQLWQKHLDKETFAKRVASYAKRACAKCV